MKIFVIVLLIVAVIFFVWQAVLFIKDLIKHIKEKKAKKEENRSDDKNADRKE